jgi:hypothetical protein
MCKPPNSALDRPARPVTPVARAQRARQSGPPVSAGVRRTVHLRRAWRATSFALVGVLVALATASRAAYADSGRPVGAGCLRIYVGDESERTSPLPLVLVSVVVQGNSSVCKCEAYTNSEGIASLGVAGGGVAMVSATLVGFHGKVVEGLELFPGHPTALNLALKPIPGSDPGVDWKSLVVEGGPPNRGPASTPTPVPRCCLPPCQ